MVIEMVTKKVNTIPKNWIDDLVGALTDPIIVFPGGGWENDMPQRIKDDLTTHRLIHLMLCAKGKAEWDEACDLEALAYMYPASMAAPMSTNWFHIYLYLGTKCFGTLFPEDIRHETLTDYEMSDLRRLKRWIHQKKMNARADRRRQEKKVERIEAEAKAPVQLGFF